MLTFNKQAVYGLEVVADLQQLAKPWLLHTAIHKSLKWGRRVQTKSKLWDSRPVS